MAKKGLGRGLASLIPDSALDGDALPAARSKLRVVPLDEIRPNPEQPRTVFSTEALGSLASSIKLHGVLQPLVVRRVDGRYVLIAGERRLRAAALAGLVEVPVVVREADDGAEQLELALVENLQRTDLDPVESALGFQRLMQEYTYTQEDVARKVGKDRSTVANCMRLLKLPPFALDALREGKISAGHARALLPVSDVDELRSMLTRVIVQQLSVRATERMVASLVRVLPLRRSGRAPQERTMDYATQLLEDALHTSVRIRALKKGGGRIVIDYADGEDLERLISHLRHEQGGPA
jgi:ParB family chromosome partitioning protein